MERLKTTGEVIDRLGGNGPLWRWFDCVPSAVANWRRDGYFPADTYIALRRVLRKKRFKVSDDLWRMRKPVGELDGDRQG